MSVSVTMPRLGESVTEGTVTRWLKQEGEQVEVDEPLLEVSTDKVDTEVPSPAAGILQSIKVQEDETVEIGVELAVIGDAAESGSDSGGDDSGSDDSGSNDSGSDDSGSAQAAAEQPAAEQEQKPEPASQKTVAEAEDNVPTEPSPQEQGAPGDSPEQPGGRTPPDPEPAPAPQPTQEQPQNQPGPQARSQSDDGSSDSDGGAYVTPLVRKLAAENGVDLASLTGTGVGGRIRKSDVLAAAESARDAQAAQPAAPAAPATPSAPAAPSAPAPSAPTQSAPTGSSAPSAGGGAVAGRTEKLSRRRALIAQRLVQSLHTSAQLTTVIEVDVTRIARLRQQAKADFQAREGVKLSFLPFFAQATIEALKAHPNVNASIDTEAGTVTYYDAENLGIAVDTEQGLVVPVIHHAGDLNLGGIARKIADLAERTRGNKISPDELSGGTFTLTNTGSRGALFDTPIITPPQVAILGTGAVVKRAVVVSDDDLGETIAVRSMVYLALSYDHQIIDGADAARFLGTIKERLEGGAFEGELGLG